MKTQRESPPGLTKQEKKRLEELKDKFNFLLNHIMNTEDFDLYQVFPDVDNLEGTYEQLSDLKKCLDSFRPLNQSQVNNLQEVFDIEYTYESNRIEGNTLTLMETDLVIHKGMTIGGKALKDHLEAINHQEAIYYIRDVINDKIAFNKEVLLNIHRMILQGIDNQNAGFYRQDRVRISGSRHICPNPIKVPVLMDEYFEWYENNKNIMHPVQLAAEMHEKLVTIHPFIDGNGRTARLVMNLILLNSAYPITVITSERENRSEYYSCLEQAQISASRDNSEFQKLIAGYVKKCLFKYLNLVSQSISKDSKNKGFYFFKTLEPFLKDQDS